MTTAPLVINEKTGLYEAIRPLTEGDIITAAKGLLEDRIQGAVVMDSPGVVSDYLVTHLSGIEHEVFSCLLLDNRHKLIEYVQLFRGTIDGCSVHPREVVKTALSSNAAAIIFAHNHPSGVPEPSKADISITQRLKEALTLVDIRVLDHIVVGGVKTVSFAERGLL